MLWIYWYVDCKSVEERNNKNNNIIILICINVPARKLVALCGRGDRSLARSPTALVAGVCRRRPSKRPTRRPNTNWSAGHVARPISFPRQVRTPITTAHCTVLARSHFEAISHLYGNSSAVRCWYRLLLRANQQPCASTAPPSKLVVVSSLPRLVFRLSGDFQTLVSLTAAVYPPFIS